MAETLWDRLCTVDVPEQFAATEKCAKASLSAAWATLRSDERAGVEALLGECATGAAGNQTLLERLAADYRPLYAAAIGVRGLVILSAEVAVPPPAARRVASSRGGAPRGGKRWAGRPLKYEECDHPWYDAVAVQLAAGV